MISGSKYANARYSRAKNPVAFEALLLSAKLSECMFLKSE